DAIVSALPILLLWVLAPGAAYWLSLPARLRLRPLDASQRALLRRTARRTWRYFETFVTEADGWLPPDNFQESGETPQLARRTSPTNIGMGLLSTLAAHDLGYVSTASLADRLDATMTTLEGLERHAGHFLNWYDTSNRAPLRPHYVSTVDSGNLAGALIALSQGLLQIVDSPQTTDSRLAGLVDTASVLAELAASTPPDPADDSPSRDRLADIATAVARAAQDARTSGGKTALDTLARDLAAATPVDGPEDLAFWTRATLDAIRLVRQPPPTTDTVDAMLHGLAGRAARMADEMRFDILY